MNTILSSHQAHTTLGPRTGERSPRGHVYCTHTHTCRAAKRQVTTQNTPWVRLIGETHLTYWGRSKDGNARALVRARPGCIGAKSKRHLEPWQQPVTGKRVHSTEWGLLPSSGTPQLKPQG